MWYNLGKYEVEDWRYHYTEALRILGIESVTSCHTGRSSGVSRNSWKYHWKPRYWNLPHGSPWSSGCANYRIQHQVNFIKRLLDFDKNKGVKENKNAKRQDCFCWKFLGILRTVNCTANIVDRDTWYCTAILGLLVVQVLLQQIGNWDLFFWLINQGTSPLYSRCLVFMIGFSMSQKMCGLSRLLNHHSDSPSYRSMCFLLVLWNMPMIGRLNEDQTSLMLLMCTSPTTIYHCTS